MDLGLRIADLRAKRIGHSVKNAGAGGRGKEGSPVCQLILKRIELLMIMSNELQAMSFFALYPLAYTFNHFVASN